MPTADHQVLVNDGTDGPTHFPGLRVSPRGVAFAPSTWVPRPP